MLTTGMTPSTATTTRAAPVRLHRTQAGSCWTLRIVAAVMALGFSKTVSVLMSQAPAFQQVDQHEHGERNDQQHDSNCRRFAVSELLEARDDQDRGDFRFVWHVPRDEDHRAVLANTAGKCQGKARD